MTVLEAVPAPASVHPYAVRPLPLCAHCGLPVAGRGAADEPLYCCTGCVLAHRITGGAAGHGRATGLLMSVGIGAFLAMNVMMLSFVLYSGTGEADRAAGEAWVRWALLGLATPALALLGAPFVARGARRLARWQLDTDALIVLGVGAAFALSAHSVLSGSGPLYLDTAMGILLFVTLGRYLEAAARARTTDALAGLLRQMPAEAARLGEDGREERVAVAALAAGDRIRVRPGERIPADGVVEAGEASVAQAELTGEPLPLAVAPGAGVAAGTLDLDGDLVVRVERTGEATTLARIVRLVEEARAGGYPLAALVDRAAAAFVPIVLVVALATLAGWTFAAGFGTGVMNALSVLLIACPCAIGIATPLAATAACGRAAAAGVLVRSGETFERLARARRVFFDKTGTLSRGELELVEVSPAPGVGRDDLLRLAAALEQGSEHPVARALRAAVPVALLPAVSGFRAMPGRGVEARVATPAGPRPARLGSAEFAGAGDAGTPRPGTTRVHLAVDGAVLGALAFADAPRPQAAPAVAALARRGLAVELLSGDDPAVVAAFAAGLPGVAAHGGLPPEAKLARLRAAVAAGETPVMVGDGINDAPALSAAAVGVTLESGTDLAREAAEVTVLGGDLTRLPWLVDLARRTLATARLNLTWAFSYNLVGIGLAVAGLLHPLFGAVAMIVSSLGVVLRSQRVARFPLPAAGGGG